MLSSSHSTRCFRPAMVARWSFEVSVVAIVEGATPQSSWEGRGRGVPGGECEWNEGGGEFGIEGAIEEGAVDPDGTPELKL